MYRGLIKEGKLWRTKIKNTQLNKLKNAVKNKSEATWRIVTWTISNYKKKKIEMPLLTI